MKLSEAIRIGATKRPQAKGVFFGEESGGSCALGAAYEANFGHPGEIWDAWNILNALIGQYDIDNKTVEHPIHGVELIIKKVVTDLNDSEGWSRERIADWLETQGL